ncbi:MAG: rhomboid family intramembrane serine protease [Thermoanaerobaculia bacterium]
MLIPTGVVENEVRRTPWVSISLLCLLVAVFLVGVRGGFGDRQRRHLGEKVEQALEYWVERPWLRPPDALADLVGPGLAAEISAEISELRTVAVARRLVPISFVVVEQQRQLESLFAEAAGAARNRRDLGLAFVPARPGVAGLFGHMFLHGDLWHLLGNLLMLFITAPFLEDVYGRLLFGALYLVGGLFAAGAHAIATLHPEVPLVGASGALAVVMGAFLVRLGRSHIRFLFLPILFIPALRFRFALPAFVVLPLWFVEQVVSARLAPDAPIAWWAHIGGFAFGVAAAFAVRLLRVEERWVNPAIEGKIGWSQDPALLKASDARAAGAFATARNSARAVLAKDPGNLDAWRSLLDTESASGRKAEAASAATRLLERYVATEERELAVALVDEVREPLLAELPARFFLAAATARERAGDAEAAYSELEAFAATRPGDPAAVRAAMRMAALARGSGREDDALDLLSWAKGHPACEEGYREAASRAEAELTAATGRPAGGARPLPARRFAARGEARTLPAHADR